MIRTWEVHGIASEKIVSRSVRSTSLLGAIRRVQFGRNPLRNVHGGKLLQTSKQVARYRTVTIAAYKWNREMFP